MDSFERFYFNSDTLINKLSEKLYSESLIAFARNNSSTISSIDEDKNGNLWLGTWDEGLIKFNKADESWERIYATENQNNELSSNRIVDVLVDSENVIWVGTFGKGINRIKNHQLIENIEFEYFTFNRNNLNSLSSNNVISIFEDSFGNIWIGTFGYGMNKLPANERNRTADKVKFKKLKVKETNF